MASKTSSADEVRSAVRGIVERGEEVIGVFLEEILDGLHVRDELSKTVRRAAGARKRVEGNIESLLTLLSVPTRSDYKRLAKRIDELQGSLVNINMKLDRLLAERGASPALSVPHAKPAARRGAKRATKRSGR
jgi:hypothetical protein